MNTSLTTKISNHILDNEIIFRKKSINKKSGFSSVQAFSAGINTVIHSGYTSAINSGHRGHDEELRISMLE